MYCQKCRTPLRLDSSLDNLTPAAFKLLTEASGGKTKNDLQTHGTNTQPLYTEEQKQRYDQAVQSSRDPTLKRTLTSPGREAQSQQQAPENPAMSFVMLSESAADAFAATTPSRNDANQSRRRQSNSYKTGSDEENLLSHKMEATTRLFEILSSRSDIDHPICTECTDLLIEGMEKRLQNATKERDAYLEFLKNASADLPTDEERRQVEEQLQAVRSQEATAISELEQLENEKAALEDEIAQLDAEARHLDVEEKAFWIDRNAFAESLAEYQDAKDSLNLRYEHDSRQLEKLSRTNVFNDTFCISHNAAGFGTINDLRLGRKKDITVPWPEINAAWGQALLLLATVAEKLDYTFEGYKLHPVGSTSTIEKLETTTTPSQSTTSTSTASTQQQQSKSKQTPNSFLSLFYSSELPLSLGFVHKPFDNAMIAFLECLRQLGAHVQQTTAGTSESGGHGLKMNFEIRKDRIGDTSIKLPIFEDIEGWNTACKRVLTCCGDTSPSDASPSDTSNPSPKQKHNPLNSGSDSGGGSMSTGDIIGAVTGCICASAIIIGGLRWFFKRRKRSSGEQKPPLLDNTGAMDQIAQSSPLYHPPQPGYFPLQSGYYPPQPAQYPPLYQQTPPPQVPGQQGWY